MKEAGMWRILVYPLGVMAAIVLVVSDFWVWGHIMAWATEDMDHGNFVLAVSAVIGWPAFQIAAGCGAARYYYGGSR
jgi:hypothetical protein